MEQEGKFAGSHSADLSLSALMYNIMPITYMLDEITLRSCLDGGNMKEISGTLTDSCMLILFISFQYFVFGNFYRFLQEKFSY